MSAQVVRPPSPELAAKQRQATAAARNMYDALQRKERASALEMASIAGQLRELLVRIEAEPQNTAAVNKWWAVLYEANKADGAVLNDTMWSALVGMSKKAAREAAKAQPAAE
jgi:hypothetical protein